MNLKNTIFYHIVADSPLVVLTGLYAYKIIPTLWFIILMIFFAFVYRVWVDKARLKSLGLITGKESYWRIFWLRFKHYSRFMFGK